MGLQLTVLGSAGSHTGVGRACSGYLVEVDGTRLLVDAGNGSTANLQRLCSLRELDAVAISHRHVDHCIDLIGCYYNLRFDPAFDGQVPLYAAAEVHELLTSMMSNDSTLEFDLVFRHQQVGHGDEAEVGPMHLRFAHSIHPVPAVSVRIEAGGRTLVYSGDSAGGDELVEIARGADLFLCEASWTGDIDDWLPGIHLTATQAGHLAREAGVGRLVLTHITGAVDRDVARAEAATAFGGPVHLAEDLDTYAV
ncbi:MAG: MBL fold metallo-hydrolase [Nitriliruptoraceae bacterium]|nr:MBL fold metallo-hydrolase [Nitriliruptoraceae bacterium]